MTTFQALLNWRVAAAKLATILALAAVIGAIALFLSSDGSSADTLPQPFTTRLDLSTTPPTAFSEVECDPHGFEVDADVHVGTVPNDPAPPSPGPGQRTLCPGDDWSTPSGAASLGGDDAVFQSTGTDIKSCATAIDADHPNNPNFSNDVTIARTANFPTSAFLCDDNALAGNTDCTTHTQGDKVFDGIYSIVEGGAQPKADIENAYSTILDTDPPTAIVGYERVTNTGDTHLNVAFKQAGAILDDLSSACPGSTEQISSGWTIGDLIANVNYAGGTAQPTISVFKVECVEDTVAPGLINCPGAPSENGAADLCQLTPGALEVDNFCAGVDLIPPLTEGPFGNATCSDTSDNDSDGFVDDDDPDCLGRLSLTNCDVQKQQNQLRCNPSNDATAGGSDVEAGYWRATICAGTQDNPSGSSAGCRETSSLDQPVAPGNTGQPESQRPERTFIEVRLSGSFINPCFANFQVQSRASGESVTSALSDIGEASFPGCKIRIEKKDALTGTLLPGGTFRIAPNPFACRFDFAGDATKLDVTDDVAPDSDPTDGIIEVTGICPGTYTITEIVAPNGYSLNPPASGAAETGAQCQNSADDDGDTLVNDGCGSVTCTVSATQTTCSPIPVIYDLRGSISWEKRNDLGALQGGATFTLSPNPDACLDDNATGADDASPITVNDDVLVDDPDANLVDDDNDAGQISVGPACLATYTVTETVAPSGFALDDDVTRVETVSDVANGADDDGDTVVDDQEELFAIIGTADFTTHPPSLPAPPGTADNCPDPTPTAGSDGDETDFCNRRGSLEWEKRDGSVTGNPLQGGATFTVSPNPDACVDDNATGADDASPITVNDDVLVDDPDANLVDDDNDAGQFQISPACLAAYTITETVPPPGYALPASASRTCTVSATELNCVVGTQGTDDCANTTANEQDFCNRRGSLAWEKRLETTATPHPLQGGATFTVSPNPDACVDDNATGADDASPITVNDDVLVDDPDANLVDDDNDAGQFLISPACLATYTVTETVAPVGVQIDDDPDRVVTVSLADLNAVIGTQGVDDDDPAVPASNESDFHNIPPREGCTPGFWQGGAGSVLWNTSPDAQWTAAGGVGNPPFIHTTLFNSFFTPHSGLAGLSMFDLVSTGGGSDNFRKAARSLVAAYLNASFGLDYPFNTATLIAMWNAANDGDDSDGEFLALHTTLNTANQLGCPLGANVLSIGHAVQMRSIWLG
ncbi:MAG: SpaA isopeptide-forming pilin-related protein [Dehalococcoidia bacterium]|nr:SpaA isopeptide-forming pilin-related protein [Dehalococcoidia bacterium]